MARIYSDHMECSCGCEEFKEEIVCRIRKEAAKTARDADKPFSDRFLEDKTVRYVCTKCNTVLDA